MHFRDDSAGHNRCHCRDAITKLAIGVQAWVPPTVMASILSVG